MYFDLAAQALELLCQGGLVTAYMWRVHLGIISSHLAKVIRLEPYNLKNTIPKSLSEPGALGPPTWPPPLKWMGTQGAENLSRKKAPGHFSPLCSHGFLSGNTHSEWLIFHLASGDILKIVQNIHLIFSLFVLGKNENFRMHGMLLS